MDIKTKTTSSGKPEPFNPYAVYPSFDENATESINGENVILLKSLLDDSYQHEVPDLLINLSVLAPDDHRLRDAITHNIALQLLESLRPGWPLRVLEWLVMPDLLLSSRKELRLTEKYLAESLNGSPGRKAALSRVIRALPLKRIALMSKDAQITAYNILSQSTSTPAVYKR